MPSSRRQRQAYKRWTLRIWLNLPASPTIRLSFLIELASLRFQQRSVRKQSDISAIPRVTNRRCDRFGPVCICFSSGFFGLVKICLRLGVNDKLTKGGHFGYG